MPSIVAQEELHSPLVRGGLAYWSAKKGTHRLPARAEFDPLIEMPKLAPHMMLKDVRQEPLDFRYRLVGTTLRQHLRADPTGKWMSGIPGQGPGNPLWTSHERAVEIAAPVFLRPAYVGPHKEFLSVESVILPLGTDHETVDMLMIVVDFIPGPPPRP